MDEPLCRRDGHAFSARHRPTSDAADIRTPANFDREHANFRSLRGTGSCKQVTSVATDTFPSTIEFDAELVETRQFRGVIVVLNVLDPRRPIDLALSEDTRLLGLFVRSIHICDLESRS